MADEQLIRQIEQALDAIRSGDERAVGRLADLLNDARTVEKIVGDRIDIGDISHAKAVAIGRGARVVIHQRSDLPRDVIDRLVALADFLEMQGVPAPPRLPDVIPTVKPDKADYIFLCYARPDQPIAERVEEYLIRAGFRVFRDRSALRCGDNWDMVIERALHKTGRMVLLLSEHSMPYRKEVHREWFYYDQEHKPIHPLYLRPCELHSRLYAYQYIAVGNDLYAALGQLVADLTCPPQPVPQGAPGDRIVITPAAGLRPVPEALQDLLKAVRGEALYVALSRETVAAILKHRPADLTEYRLGRIAE
jgi:hypothetical protein